MIPKVGINQEKLKDSSSICVFFQDEGKVSSKANRGTFGFTNRKEENGVPLQKKKRKALRTSNNYQSILVLFMAKQKRIGQHQYVDRQVSIHVEQIECSCHVRHEGNQDACNFITKERFSQESYLFSDERMRYNLQSATSNEFQPTMRERVSIDDEGRGFNRRQEEF